MKRSGDCDKCGIGIMMPLLPDSTYWSRLLRYGGVFRTQCDYCGHKSYISEQYMIERIIERSREALGETNGE